MLRRIALLGLCGAVAAFLPAGCGRAPPGAAGTLTVLDPADERIFTPAWDMPAKFLLFLPLLGAAASPDPALARSWEHSPDHRTWTVRLRSDVRWHDGEPVTAHDVAFTFELLARPEIGYAFRAEIQVPDDSTFVFTAARPIPAADTWTVVLPRHLLQELDPARFFEWEFWRSPVGNGPFRWVRVVEKTLVELEANRDFPWGAPGVDRLLIKFGGSAPLPELLAGRVDAASYVSRADVRKLAGDTRYRIYEAVLPELTWLEAIFWNQRSPLFQDARVRRALTHAIDRLELRRMQELPDTLPLFDVIGTGRQLWSGAIPPPLPYDPAAARALLAAAGWVDSDGDGVLDREGEPFRFTAHVASGGNSATWAFMQAAVYVQAQLAQVGIRMELLPEASPQGRYRSGDFDALFFRFFNHPQGHAEAFGEESRVRWRQPEVVAALQALMEIPQPARRDSVYRALMPIFQAEVPITFLGPQVQHFVAHRRVIGLSSPFHAEILAHLAHVHLEPR